MDILDILLDILLKPPQCLMGLFLTIQSMLYMSVLSTLGISISNAFNAIYVEAVDTFSTQYTHM